MYNTIVFIIEYRKNKTLCFMRYLIYFAHCADRSLFFKIDNVILREREREIYIYIYIKRIYVK